MEYPHIKLLCLRGGAACLASRQNTSITRGGTRKWRTRRMQRTTRTVITTSAITKSQFTIHPGLISASWSFTLAADWNSALTRSTLICSAKIGSVSIVWKAYAVFESSTPLQNHAFSLSCQALETSSVTQTDGDGSKIMWRVHSRFYGPLIFNLQQPPLDTSRTVAYTSDLLQEGQGPRNYGPIAKSLERGQGEGGRDRGQVILGAGWLSEFHPLVGRRRGWGGEGHRGTDAGGGGRGPGDWVPREWRGFENRISVVVQIVVLPFWVLSIVRPLIFRGPKRGP